MLCGKKMESNKGTLFHIYMSWCIMFLCFVSFPSWQKLIKLVVYYSLFCAQSLRAQSKWSFYFEFFFLKKLCYKEFVPFEVQNFQYDYNHHWKLFFSFSLKWFWWLPLKFFLLVFGLLILINVAIKNFFISFS